MFSKNHLEISITKQRKAVVVVVVVATDKEGK